MKIKKPLSACIAYMPHRVRNCLVLAAACFSAPPHVHCPGRRWLSLPKFVRVCKSLSEFAKVLSSIFSRMPTHAPLCARGTYIFLAPAFVFNQPTHFAPLMLSHTFRMFSTPAWTTWPLPAIRFCKCHWEIANNYFENHSWKQDEE